MGRLLGVIRELRRLLSSAAVMPMAGVDRRRYFRLAGQLRMIVIAVLGTVVIWLLRDRSLPFLLLIVFLTYPGIAVTWLTLKARGVLAPHVWLRDLIGVAFFAAIAPPYLVPAMMCSLMILAFCSYTMERNSTNVLAVSSIIAISVAALASGDEVARLPVAFYPLAVIGIVLPISLASATLHRWHATTNGIADALGLCLWEIDDLPIKPYTVTTVYGNLAKVFGPNVIPVLTNTHWEELLHPDDAAASATIDESIDAGKDYRVRYRQRQADGTYPWIEEVGHVEVNNAGIPVRVSGFTHDIDSTVETGEQLSRLDNIVESLPVAISIMHLVDPADPTSLTVLYENEASARINANVARIGRRLIDIDPRLFETERHRGLGFMMAAVAAGGEPFSVPDANLPVAGQVRLHSLRVSPLPGNRIAVIVEDLHELHTARRELERTAFVDPLTELPNRARIRKMLVDAPVGSVLAVLDLDRFTDIIDSFGHSCGDQMIVEVARVLAEAPDGVSVARLGGDEFGILAPPGLATHAELGRQVEAALRRPFTLPNGLTLQASASIGITSKNRADTPPDELLRQADVAVNRAKRLHSGIEIYSPASDSSAPHRMMLMGEIRRAIGDRELELHFQPMIECSTGRTVRFEAMLRWRHPSLGLLQTGDLIEMMELSNLNSDLVRYCLDVAIDQCTTWHADGHVVPISINVGGGTVHDAELVDSIIGKVEDAGLPPFTIGLELAERHLMLGSGISGESTRRLADAGIWIAIDQFGTGTSPMSAVPHIAAHALKIDWAFANDLCRGDGQVLQAIAAIFHKLGLMMCVIGVDDQATAAWLIDNGADRIQGTAVGEPVAPADLPRLLAQATVREVANGAVS
ncbi:MAG: EAL domain-containing protein [Actinomycetota bacterium]|jgi:diguanylate cyclase (GGDEF)-like protein